MKSANAAYDNTMKVLAIDAATEACSVALNVDGRIQENYQIAPRRHTQLLLKDIDALLKAAALSARELDVVAYGCGPGAFTGVRLTLSVSQAFAYGHDLSLLPVGTLESLAWQTDAAHDEHVFVALDARMGQVYFAAYKRTAQGLHCLIEPSVADPDQVETLSASAPWRLAGSGLSRYPSLAQRICKTGTLVEMPFPRAAGMAELAVHKLQAGVQPVAPIDATVMYVRNEVAAKPRQASQQV